MGVPRETLPRAGIAVSGGGSVCFSMAIAPRCYIKKIAVQQMSGDIVNFTVEIFNHPSICDDHSISDTDVEDRPDTEEDVGPLGEDLFRVTPVLQGDEGHLIVIRTDDGYLFYPQGPAPGDGRLDDHSYVRIRPEGSGAKTFACVLGYKEGLA